MINSEKNVFLLETEVKPNRYSLLVMVFTVIGMAFCWFLNEIGIFRAGLFEMRIGSAVPLFFLLLLLTAVSFRKSMLEKPFTKWLIFASITILTIFINTLLTFHTTIMLLFPMFVAMLYRSVAFGVASLISSVATTILSPVIGYVFHFWDIPLLEELIGIGTGGSVVIENATSEITMLSIGKIVLYLVLPRMIMVGSCALLMFHVIRLGTKHVNNLVLLEQISRRDALTGLYNQNYYKQVLSSPKKSRPIGVIFLDVNGLKTVNDSFGHEQGDFLLKRCADCLIAVCDSDDTNGFRIGGDEFLLLVENADEAKIARKKEALLSALATVNKENESLYDGLVCSMAMGVCSGDMSELETLIRRADILMYEDKNKYKRCHSAV